MGLMQLPYLAVVAIVSACVVAMLRWGWRLLSWAWLRPRTLERHLRQQGLEGNPYKLLYGDLREIYKMKEEALSKPCSGWSAQDVSHRVDPFLHHTISIYGENSFFWMGPLPTVNVLEPQLIREVLTKYEDFHKPLLSPVSALLLPGLVSCEGENWLFRRKLLNPAFHVEKLKLMIPEFYASCLELVTLWENIVPRSGSIELDIVPHMTTLTSDAISRVAFGSCYEEGRRIFELLNELMRLALQLGGSLYIPGSRFLPTAVNRRIKEVDQEMQTLLRGIIYKRKEKMEAGEATKEDLLGTLLQSSFGEAGNQGGTKGHVKMTIKELVDECKLFYLAGQETTTVLLVWTMILLSKHQDWQDRAREEVIDMFGEGKPDYDRLNQLKIVTMILHEVLRLYPPVVAMHRLVRHDIKLGKAILPAGILIHLPIMLLHHDPQIWGKDALEFNPERFSEGVSKAMKGNIAYFPFSWGPRVCIGQNFALVEAKIALAMILRSFSFELSPAYVHSPTTILTIKPQHGAHVMLRRL